MASRIVYQVWYEDEESGATVARKMSDNVQDARERASDLDDYIILRREQETRGEDKVWTDLSIRVVQGEFWNAYLSQITDVEVQA